MKSILIIITIFLFFLTSCVGNNQPFEFEQQGQGFLAQEELAISELLPINTPTPVNQPEPTSTFTTNNPVNPSSLLPPWQDEIQGFIPEKLRLGVTPVPYIDNVCFYLENRWGDGKSDPGTIVVPIMFHSVAKPGWEVNDPSAVTRDYFEYFIESAKEMGYRTITMDELVGFLESNEVIPERSMIIILDDRRPGVTELFMPYLEENDWTLTLGWITTETTRDSVWERMTDMAATGRLDVQSHGHDHIYIQEYMTLEMIVNELEKPFDVIETRFGNRPVAIIWPGGNFTEAAIAVAQSAGYRLGFTVYSRGPLLFNWIPLGEPEIAMDDPLLVLPRFWSSAAVKALEEGIMIGEAAREAAESVREQELEFLSRYCQPTEDE